jgi:Ig-like domain from next to BRCA1 gene
LANGVNPTNMGKGDWTFYLSDAESNLGQSSVQALFNYEASQGVRFVVCKAQDGTSTGEWGYSASVVTAAHNAGLKIFAYGYLYGNYYGAGGEAAELSTTLSIISSTSPDGFVIDAETEYNNQPTAASNYCAGFKASYPNLFLSYSPFVDISEWPNYPYIQFGQYCDAVMPQAYFEVGPGYSPSGMVSYMDSQWSSWQNGLAGTQYASSIKPIVPICQAYNDQYFTDNGSDLISFVNDLKSDSTPATAGGYQGVSFFDADNETAQMRVEISEATIGTGGENAGEVSQSVANNTTFLTSQAFSCTFVMTNNGAIAWTNTDFSFNYTGGTQMGAASVTHASTNVPPGATTSFTINFTAPATPGTYTADFQMNDNYGYNFGQPVSLTVVISTGNGAALGPMTVPSSVPVGQSFSATVNMTNTGVVSWTSSGNYHLGSQSPEDNTTWGFDRVNLPSSSISPGQGAVFSFTPTAPSTPGTYAFAWAMVQDGVQWFGPTNSKNITVFIPVPSIITQPQSQTVNLGGAATFSVTVSNVGGPFYYQWALGGTNIVGACHRARCRNLFGERVEPGGSHGEFQRRADGRAAAVHHGAATKRNGDRRHRRELQRLRWWHAPVELSMELERRPDFRGQRQQLRAQQRAIDQCRNVRGDDFQFRRCREQRQRRAERHDHERRALYCHATRQSNCSRRLDGRFFCRCQRHVSAELSMERRLNQSRGRWRNLRLADAHAYDLERQRG